jgi:hypothetical protein
MRKDVFVDNNVAKDFCNPPDPCYKEFIKWLYDEGHLAVSNKILAEYVSSTGASSSPTNMVVIVARLTRDGRLIKFTQQQLDGFKFSKSEERNLRSNRKDHSHLKVVLLSDRKFAVSLDDNFRYDVNNFPGHRAIACKRPDELAYR